VFFAAATDIGAVVRAALARPPIELLDALRAARLRGRGGAGFATATKWALCAQAEGNRKHIICNADEGEPGTFKDRVLLTHQTDLVLAGMVLAAHAVGASNGIIYRPGSPPCARRGCSARHPTGRASTSGSSSAPAPTSAGRSRR
jgi:[NiFe] hydrogenase diaphorase moiety large subunit